MEYVFAKWKEGKRFLAFPSFLQTNLMDLNGYHRAEDSHCRTAVREWS